MIVVVDMILAVAEIALAAGAIPELQLRVGQISPTADGAFMGIGRFGRCNGGLIGSGIGEGDGLRFLLGAAFFEQPPGVHPPGHGDHIEDIFAKEQEIVGKGNHGEQIIGEGIAQQTDNHQR